MSKVVLITGDLAAGKSTLADSLSSKFGFTCIKKDKLKEGLGDVIGFNNREENRKLSIASVELMMYFLKQSMVSNTNIVLEANFRLNEISDISKIVNDSNSELRVIYLTGDYDVLYKRFMHRVPHRHKVHLSMGLDKDFEKFKNYINELRTQIQDIDCCKIDTSLISLKEVENIASNYLISTNFIG